MQLHGSATERLQSAGGTPGALKRLAWGAGYSWFNFQGQWARLGLPVHAHACSLSVRARDSLECRGDAKCRVDRRRLDATLKGGSTVRIYYVGILRQFTTVFAHNCLLQ